MVPAISARHTLRCKYGNFPYVSGKVGLGLATKKPAQSVSTKKTTRKYKMYLGKK